MRDQLQAVGRVESTRIVGEHTTTEYRDFLCSFTDPERFTQTVRGQWGIETPLPLADSAIALEKPGECLARL